MSELEQRIADRTAELEATDKKLAHEIAERKRTEAQLHFQAQLLDGVRESVVATDLEGRVTYWSKGAESLYGYRAGEVMGHSIAAFIVESHEQQEEEQRMRTVRETGSWSGRYVQHRQDGSTFWADTFISLVTDEHGRPSGFIGIDRDATEHKQAEEALRESEARLTLAQEAADIGTGDWDIKSDKVYWSNHQFHLHGMAPTENNMISLEAWLALVHPDDRVRSVDVIKASVKSGGGFSAEYRVVWPDNQVRWLCGTARVLRDDNGHAVRMIGVSIDITERKLAEHGLRERTRHLEGLIRTSAKLAATMKTDQTLDAIAEEAASLLGVEGAGFRLLEGDQLVVAGTYGHARNIMLTPAIKVGQSLTGRVARDGRAIAVPDLRHEQRFHEEHRKAAMLRGVVAYLGVPLRYRDRIIGVLNVYGTKRRTFPAAEVSLLQAFADQAAVAIERARLYDGAKQRAEELHLQIAERKLVENALRESHQRLRNLTTQLQAVREDERTIIAREVHDEMGQALTALKMDLAWTRKSLPKRWKAVPDRISSMMSLIDSTLDTVRQLSSRLRPAILDDLGLETAIEWQVHEFANRGSYECGLELKATRLRPDKKRDIAVFRILQEALTNIARHAGASGIVVKLSTNDEELLLVVEDDGKGISNDALTSAYSLGLTGMYERAQTLGGSLKIERGDNDRGTVLTLSVPLTSIKRSAQTR